MPPVNKRFLACLFLVLSPLGISSVFAHEGRPVYVEVVQDKQDGDSFYVTMRWKIPPVMVRQDEPTIDLIGPSCDFFSGPKRARLTGTKIYQCTGTFDDAAVQLRYPNKNPVLSTLVVLNMANGQNHSVLRGPEHSRILLPGQEAWSDVVGQYLLSGVQHILSGYDHLLFVICLMQLARSVRRILVVVTGFTLAHSVTLAIAALDIWRIRIDVVEILIALSIVLLAVEIVKGHKDSLTWRRPIIVAMAFGLLHGFGFASALGELGLPQTMEITALFFFNIGVELGQALVVLFLLAFVYILKKGLGPSTQRSPNLAQADILPLPKIFIQLAGCIGFYWVIDRSLNLIV
jgi:hydrogenase/urease accessory protein HupE